MHPRSHLKGLLDRRLSRAASQTLRSRRKFGEHLGQVGACCGTHEACRRALELADAGCEAPQGPPSCSRTPECPESLFFLCSSKLFPLFSPPLPPARRSLHPHLDSHLGS